MMFPVNRPASELTATELLNLYDQAQFAANDGCHHSSKEMADGIATAKELRAEIERRMKPCTVCAARAPQWYQGLQQQQALHGQYSLQAPLGSISHAIDAQRDKGGNR